MIQIVTMLTMAAGFFTLRPVVKVDYVEVLNAPVVVVPESQRAWPLYRTALIELGFVDGRGNADAAPLDASASNDPVTGDSRDLVEVRPGDAEWPDLKEALRAAAPAIGKIRDGAARTHFGFVLGPGGSENDPEVGWKGSARSGGTLFDESLLSILLPQLGPMRRLAKVLAADAAAAAEAGDGDRASADLVAVLRMGRQLRRPILVEQLVGIGILMLAFDEIETTLRDQPLLWTDAQLTAVATEIDKVDGETAGDLLGLSGERMFFYDVVQRTYSDDGHGDGKLTPAGMAMMNSFVTPNRAEQLPQLLLYATVAAPLSSRAAVVAEYDRVFDAMLADFRRPQREVWVAGHEDAVEAFKARADRSVLIRIRYLPVVFLLPSLSRSATMAERVFARRDGLRLGLAIERHRRDHGGELPAGLSDLVPQYLPAVPIDRITGGPLSYRTEAGRPIVYSVGIDRDDDGGRAARGRDGRPQRDLAGDFRPGDSPRAVPDGDWVLFDGRPPGR